VHASGDRLFCSVLEAPLWKIGDNGFCSAISFILATSSRSNLWTNGFLNPKTYISHAQEKEVFKNKRKLSVSFPAIKKV
jgi:hypothetical protein